ncbi:AMP-binding protein [Ornithinimicrobium sp. LYQ103]|uniref:AMP-binding protein n=1 Tax=Ornithinimicrobium sp. LYQ103 TaxID=3378796 RepID=UPI003854DFA7
MTTGSPDLLVPAGSTWDQLFPALRTLLHEASGDEVCDRADEPCVVVATSGSSGTPKRVRLPASALRASGEATAEVLDGHGRWVLALPTHHVAGLQVLARSVLAGTEPVALPAGPFTGGAFASAVSRAGGGSPTYASLVPTQVHRLLQDADGTAALASLDAVLVGGAAADPGLLRHAREAGARVVTTYGMSETAGGCVYDGVPLPGVVARLDPVDQRIHLAGPVLAQGYADAPDLTSTAFQVLEGRRWFVTGDRGSWQGGRLRVLGRVDDVIVTGGHKVEPRDVETALRALPGVTDAVVVGVPDEEWGQVVAAVVVPSRPTDPADDLARLRAALAPTLPAHALPRQVVLRDAIPLLPSGKPDPARAGALLRAAASPSAEG